MQKKFFVTYERTQYFQVEVEAANAAEAERKADEVVNASKLDNLYFANGDLELGDIHDTEAAAAWMTQGDLFGGTKEILRQETAV
jgi:hypothetical protein